MPPPDASTATNLRPSAEQATEVPPIPGRLLDTKEFPPSCDVYTAPGVESVKAMRDALPKLSGALKAGMIESLGARRDGASVDVLTVLAGGPDKTLAFAAINALGKIGSPEAAKSLGDIVKSAPDELKPIAADACFVCAERLSAEGKKAQAMSLYKGLSGEDQPKYVRLAATRGLLAAAKKE